jgi:hypothetical protein
MKDAAASHILQKSDDVGHAFRIRADAAMAQA